MEPDIGLDAALFDPSFFQEEKSQVIPDDGQTVEFNHATIPPELANRFIGAVKSDLCTLGGNASHMYMSMSVADPLLIPEVDSMGKPTGKLVQPMGACRFQTQKMADTEQIYRYTSYRYCAKISFLELLRYVLKLMAESKVEGILVGCDVIGALTRTQQVVSAEEHYKLKEAYRRGSKVNKLLRERLQKLSADLGKSTDDSSLNYESDQPAQETKHETT